MPGSKLLEGGVAETAKKVLRDVTNILEENEIPYILDYGTLLGVVRENRLLPWDTDLDISITSDYLEKFLKIRWKLWLAGYRTRIRVFKEDIGPFKKGTVRMIKIQTRRFFIFRKLRLMDVFVKRKLNDEYGYIVGVNPAVFKSVPVKFHDKRTTLAFDGKKYFVPTEYKEYLAYVYGDWKTPVKKWSFLTSDNCTKEINSIINKE